MQKRILFLVDHKHRDLPSLSLIGYLLKEKGHSVEFSTLGDEEKKWETYIPHLVVANKQIGDNTRLQLCKAHGIKRAVINTEGARRKGRLLTIEVPISVKSSSHETIDTKRNTEIATYFVAFIYFLNITNLSLLF